MNIETKANNPQVFLCLQHMMYFTAGQHYTGAMLYDADGTPWIAFITNDVGGQAICDYKIREHFSAVDATPTEAFNLAILDECYAETTRGCKIF